MFTAQMLVTRKAAAAGLPWEDTLDIFVDSVTGPVAKGFSILAVCVMGGLLAFGDLGGVSKRAAQAIMGLAMVLFAANFIAAIGG